MPRKNHKMVDGRLLKTDKSFSDLKMSQREKIAGWLYEEYLSMFKANGNRYSKRFDDVVLSNVYDKIEQAEICPRPTTHPPPQRTPNRLN